MVAQKTADDTKDGEVRADTTLNGGTIAKTKTPYIAHLRSVSLTGWYGLVTGCGEKEHQEKKLMMIKRGKPILSYAFLAVPA